MSELEDKLGAILGNPQMMQQIMSMAQSLGGSHSGQDSKKSPESQAPQSGFDPALLQSLAGIAQKSGVDQNQQTLLKALCPYLGQNRVSKLEKAMRAAKMAGAASSFLNAGGLQLLARR